MYFKEISMQNNNKRCHYLMNKLAEIYVHFVEDYKIPEAVRYNYSQRLSGAMLRKDDENMSNIIDELGMHVCKLINHSCRMEDERHVRIYCPKADDVLMIRKDLNETDLITIWQQGYRKYFSCSLDFIEIVKGLTIVSY